MHELSLHATLPGSQYEQFLYQLQGVTRIQPVPVQEIRLIFRTRTPDGLNRLPGVGGTQAAQSDNSKVSNALGKGIYFVTLVGSIHVHEQKPSRQQDGPKKNKKISWTFDFKDTPDAGKQAASTRLVSRIPIEAGSVADFMNTFGFEFVSWYFVKGHRVYDRETTIFTHQVFRPSEKATLQPRVASDVDQLGLSLEDPGTLHAVDPSGAYLVQASVDVIDGNVQVLKDQAIQQLAAIAHVLRGTVDLRVADRLALDTRIVVLPGQ